LVVCPHSVTVDATNGFYKYGRHFIDRQNAHKKSYIFSASIPSKKGVRIQHKIDWQQIKYIQDQSAEKESKEQNISAIHTLSLFFISTLSLLPSQKGQVSGRGTARFAVNYRQLSAPHFPMRTLLRVHFGDKTYSIWIPLALRMMIEITYSVIIWIQQQFVPEPASKQNKGRKNSIIMHTL